MSHKKFETGNDRRINSGVKMKEAKAMRDVFIEELCDRMHDDKSIFFLSGDFGSPKLDKLRELFKDRFINVGIAEQNLVNISAGLALEGYTVYAYAISAFLTMRCYEQIRINLALHSQLKEINVNLVGVGAGISYDMSGPSHHCLEDLSIMRTLPNIEVLSPSDYWLAGKFVDYSIKTKRPKYFRFDSKPAINIYNDSYNILLENCFYEWAKGSDVCIVSTGFMTHNALAVARILKERGINVGVIDVFRLKPFNDDLFYETVKHYKSLITLEEAYIDKGGLDCLVSCVLNNKNPNIRLKRLGFEDRFVFELGGRDHLHKLNHIDKESILQVINKMSKE